ncbi:hypothetical protein [Pedosphaera parvula]|uniref:Co-chaperone DjlA N-terminal domain-containing protein n=1 Tax=Pedosphaera parvula (strain Ellin514) TaxID=320771 RepID=B9X9W1_PEDPL|nr:hypothetical protein [Pedosphaera parvula]EEF63302.1 hypothetical protein Cflav_PD5937 [Pedosphaera parvula Ellin514]
MDITDFTAGQRQALLDLVVLTMYMDGNLASIEAARIQQILTAMGLDSPYDRDKEFDASVTRVSRILRIWKPPVPVPPSWHGILPRQSSRGEFTIC